VVAAVAVVAGVAVMAASGAAKSPHRGAAVGPVAPAESPGGMVAAMTRM